jgi:hypothetical protein
MWHFREILLQAQIIGLPLSFLGQWWLKDIG